jgi:hypothetical protein
MIAPVKPHHQSALQARQQETFLGMLPQIRRQAQRAFRRLGAEIREELIQEVVANAYCAFARLIERGRPHCAYPTTLAHYAIRHVRCGRGTGRRLNANDISSRRAQQFHGIRIKFLHRFDHQEGVWCELLVEDRHAGPAETAAARVDISQWLGSLATQKRQVAEALMRGEGTAAVASLFQVSPGRISQLRQELRQSWESSSQDV